MNRMRGNRSAWVLALALVLGQRLLSQAQTLPPPTFHPGEGALLPTNVTISTVVQDSKVFYTIDGSFPTTNSLLYNGPLALTNTTTIWARAFKAGWESSSDVLITYYYRPQLASLEKLVANDDTPRPSINLTVTPNQSVRCYAIQETIPLPLAVTNANYNATWDPLSRMLKWGPFNDNLPRALTYQVFGENGVYEVQSRISFDGFSTLPEDVSTRSTVTVRDTLRQVATPSFAPGPTSSVPVSITISCGTSGALVYYTLDGTAPTTNSALYTSSFSLPLPTTLRARAFKLDWSPSEVSSATYEKKPPTIQGRGVSNNVSSGPLATIRVNPTNVCNSYAVIEALPPFAFPADISHAGIWNPTNRQLRWGPFQDGLARNLSYRLTGPDGVYEPQAILSMDGSSYVIGGAGLITISNTPVPKLTLPILSTTNGFAFPNRLVLSHPTPGAEIRYTWDGSLPSTNSTLYSGPLFISNLATLSARAFASGWEPSEPFVRDFMNRPVQSVTRTVLLNTNSEAQEVRLAVSPGLGVRCYAVLEQLPVSVYPILTSHGGVWEPTTRTVRWGPFMDGQPRTLTNRLAGAVGTNELTGIASFDGQLVQITGQESLIIPQLFQKQVAPPAINPSGSLSLPVSISMSCPTPGSSIFYTLDATVPTTNSLRYTGAVQVNQSLSVRARAFAAGMIPSEVLDASFAAAPVVLGNISRTFADNASRTPTGTLSVSPSPAVRSYAVEEILAPNVIPTAISDGGVWDPETFTIRWGPFQDTTSRTLTYAVLAPDGDYAVDGVVSFNGVSTPISGQRSLVTTGAVSRVATPVISPPDGTLASALVTITCATPGATIYFTTNSSLPTTNSAKFVTSFTAGPGTCVRAVAHKNGVFPSEIAMAFYATAADSSTVTRTILGRPGPVQEVRLQAAPSASTKVWGIDEELPPGIQPTNLSAGGTWLANVRTIRWGPYQDNGARTLAYQLRAPDGEYSVRGTASFNGSLQAVAGVDEIVVAFPGPSTLNSVIGNNCVYLLWDSVPGAKGYNVHYWTSGGQTDLRLRNAGIPGGYFALTGLTNGIQYYLRVAAYDASGREGGFSPVVSAIPSANAGALGMVWFDQTGYFLTNTAAITLDDPDLNISSNSLQSVIVRVTSDSDAWGINLTLQETGTNTGRFTSVAAGRNLGFTIGNSDELNHLIHVTSVDRIYVVYNDLQPVAGVTNSAAVGRVPESYPSILVQPKKATANAGANVAFSVNAQGGGLRYQWYHSGVALSGASKSTLQLSNVWQRNAGQYHVVVSNSVGFLSSDLVELVVTLSSPYQNVRQVIPGTLRMERYDEGGQGLAYKDADAANYCGDFRAGEAIDMCYNQSTGTGVLGWTQLGEWVNYSVSIEKAGNYSVVVWHGCEGLPGREHIELDGVDVTDPIDVPISGNYSTYLPARSHNVMLPAGDHVLRLFFDTNNIGNIRGIDIVEPVLVLKSPANVFSSPGDVASFSVLASGTSLAYQWQKYGTNLPGATQQSLSLTNVRFADSGPYRVVITNAAGAVTSSVAMLTVTGPYGGTAQKAPGRIKVEDFDEGGEGIAYHDSDTTNSLGKYRLTEYVDVGWAANQYVIATMWGGEWIHYTIDIEKDGVYSVVCWNGTPASNGTYHIEVDGENVTGTIAVGATGGYSKLKPTRKDGVALTKGRHVLRYYVESPDLGTLAGIDVLSPPQFSSVARKASDQSVVLTFPTVAGLDYEVQYRTNLTSSPWISLTGRITATNSVTEVPDQLNFQSQKFYRLILQ